MTTRITRRARWSAPLAVGVVVIAGLLAVSLRASEVERSEEYLGINLPPTASVIDDASLWMSLPSRVLGLDRLHHVAVEMDTGDVASFLEQFDDLAVTDRPTAAPRIADTELSVPWVDPAKLTTSLRIETDAPGNADWTVVIVYSAAPGVAGVTIMSDWN